MAISPISGTDTVKYIIETLLYGNDLPELYASVDSLSAASGVKVSLLDQVIGTLQDKLLGGAGVTLTKGNPGGNENLTISIDIVGDTTPQLGGPLDGQGNGLSNVIFSNTGEKVQALGLLPVDTDIDLSLGNIATFSTSNPIEISFSNFPASGTAGYAVLFITNGGLHTLTWPAGTIWTGAGGYEPNWLTSGLDIAVFLTIDGGTKLRGSRVWTGVA